MWSKFSRGSYQYPRLIFETLYAKIRGYNNGKSHLAFFLSFTLPEAKKVLKRIKTKVDASVVHTVTL